MRVSSKTSYSNNQISIFSDIYRGFATKSAADAIKLFMLLTFDDASYIRLMQALNFIFIFALLGDYLLEYIQIALITG